MNGKEKKSAGELRSMVLYKVRQQRDWNNILDVAFYRPVQASDNYPKLGRSLYDGWILSYA